MRRMLLFPALFLFILTTNAQHSDSLQVAKQVDSLLQISRTLTGQRDFDKAIEVNVAAEALALYEFGRESAAYGSCCYNHGRICYFKRDFPQSEKWYLDSKAIREKVLGKWHPELARSLTNLALVYQVTSNFEKAEPLFSEAITIWAKSLGKDHADYAWGLNNLGNLYLTMDDYEKAEPLYINALTIRQRALGKENPSYANTLNNLAILYRRMGNLEKAEPLYLEALSIQEKSSGKESIGYASALGNLAILYRDMGKVDKAEPRYLESIELLEKIYGKKHPDYAVSLGNLAILYSDIGKTDQSEALYLQSISILEESVSREHPDYALNLNNLGRLYYDLQAYEKAETLYMESQAIWEKILGKHHPGYGENLNNLSLLYWKSGKKEKASPLFSEVATVGQNRIVKAQSHLSEREIQHYIKTYSVWQSQTLAFTQETKDLKIVPTCYNNSLFYKGFLLNAANQTQNLAQTNLAATENFNLLKSYGRRLAAQYALPIAERDSTAIAELEAQANAIEKELVRTVAGFGETRRQVSWQEVQSELKPREAAIEFVSFSFWSKKQTDSIMYAALLLRPGDTQPRFISLFEEKQLSPLLRGASGGGNFMKINKLYNQNTLYDLLWKPLEPLLTETNTIYYSPSGLLHRINLAAIATPEGKPYGDRRQLIALGSTRQLVVNSNSSQITSNTAYLTGGIRYTTDSTSAAYAGLGTATRSTEPGVLTFYPDSLSISRGEALDYLPATVAEVQEIGQMIKTNGFQSKLDTGFYATEESFRQLGVDSPSPRIIHLATHGYFFPDPDTRLRKAGIEGEPVFKMSDHPMIRSGLIMAGAEQAWFTGKHPEGREDGILTAYEISQMNLSGTELVVLSACETGLGDIVGNEGVYGLQRAFKIAGAKYLIMSLWKVDDQSTRAFMTSFYRHWLVEKQTVSEAFRSTQQEMRHKYSEPYDWAGFVLIE